MFFSKLGSPYRKDDSFFVIETDVEILALTKDMKAKR